MKVSMLGPRVFVTSFFPVWPQFTRWAFPMGESRTQKHLAVRPQGETCAPSLTSHLPPTLPLPPEQHRATGSLPLSPAEIQFQDASALLHLTPLSLVPV